MRKALRLALQRGDQSDLRVEIHGRICTGRVLHFHLLSCFTPHLYTQVYACAAAVRARVQRRSHPPTLYAQGMVVWLPGSALTRINKNPGDGERMDKTRTASVRIMKRVICLGSYQGSDTVAWHLADTLHASPDVSADFEIVRCASPAQLVSLCAGAAALAIIDASPDLEPGSVRRLSEYELAGCLSYSSHGVDLLTAMGLARALGDLPARVAIVGIGVDDREPGLLVTCCLPAVLAELRAL